MHNTIKKRGSYESVFDIPVPVSKAEYAFDDKGVGKTILEAVCKGTPITIFGDYDVDGCTATAAWVMAIKGLQFAKANPAVRAYLPPDVQKRIAQCTPEQLAANPPVDYRTPLRHTEGFGLKETSVIDENGKLKMRPGVLLTVDNGIASIDAVARAHEMGMYTIVTDHHQPNADGTLPPADIILNPHVEQNAGDPKHCYEYYDYCGAGVSYKVISKLLGEHHPISDCVCALAALGTVADVMPVNGDNRNIIIKGSDVLLHGNVTKGMLAILDICGINRRDLPPGYTAHNILTTSTIGFQIAPLFNAASRMEDNGAMDYTIKTLLCQDAAKAVEYAGELKELNQRRKNLQQQENTMVDRIIKENHMENDIPLVIYLPEGHPGIMGLHAGSLCEKYHVPVCVITKMGDLCKGSCRAPEGANMFELMTEAGEFLEGYGGHEGAGGLVIKEENIDAFREKLKDICAEKGISRARAYTYYDLSIKASDVPKVSAYMRDVLTPFGEGNPAPKFLVDFDTISDRRHMGNDGQHFKIAEGSVSAVGFNITDELPANADTTGSMQVIGELGFNYYRGTVTDQVLFDTVRGEDEEIIDRDEPDLTGGGDDER